MDGGSYHHEEIEIPAAILARYQLLIDCLQEEPDVLKQVYVDVSRLCSAQLLVNYSRYHENSAHERLIPVSWGTGHDKADPYHANYARAHQTTKDCAESAKQVSSSNDRCCHGF